MPPETVLLESRAMRDSVIGRVDVLDKVKALSLLPDGLHITTQMLADYYEVGERVINRLMQRHRAELSDNGMRVLRGADLQVFERDNLALSMKSYPQGRAHLTIYSRRAVLNTAMLLRDSEVARRVRTHLLDSEAYGRRQAPVAAPGYASLDARLTRVESCLADIGPALRDLGPVIGRMSVRLERLDRRLEATNRRLDATNRVVGAMSERLSDLAADVRELRGGPRGSVARRRSRG
ncbi:hypothetical protein [Streptomyces sp. MST-110588]|uniref:hypothetical protein n=1 Tax=Streptomyces sp. MST-110588 TaxID=2833628 RepID=UPI001F5DEB15|nr:hypothetical protein [Streptomyces sp. MST-110588]UNO40877.1 hypothetical protein KGS77_16450 [Streptomyces sp. MST-110588]